jgi:hypothetical protein
MTIRSTTGPQVSTVNGQSPASGDIVIPPASSVFQPSPADAGTVSVLATHGTVIITPAGTLNTLTINLPASTSAFGNRVTICSSQAVTTVTMTATSTTIIGLLASLAIGGFATFVLKGSIWYRCG